MIRQAKYSDHDVLTQFKLQSSSGDQGNLVTFVTYDPDQWAAGVTNISPHAHPTTGGPFVGEYNVSSEVKLSDAAGTFRCQVAGVLLMPVRTQDAWAIPTRITWLSNQRKGYVRSGEPVPIATRGFFILNTLTNSTSAGPGSGLISATGGQMTVVDGSNPTGYRQKLIGKCVSQSGTGGYTAVFLDCC